MILWGLARCEVQEVVVYSTREEAEDALRQVLDDEPELAGVVGVERVALRRTVQPQL